MATIANINLKDSANVNKVYVPETVQTGKYASWVNRDQGTTAGIKRAYTQLRDRNGNYERRQVFMSMPVIDAVSGAVSRTNTFDGEFRVHINATLAEKQELVNSVAAMMGLAPIQTNVNTGESISG